MNKINEDKIKESLGLLPSARLRITKVTNGWNIRVIKPSIIKDKKNFSQILKDAGHNSTVCRCCHKKTYCHPHHIIPKSAGGQDDPDNGVFLCFDCHVGDNAVHDGRWQIESIVHPNLIKELKERYKL